MDLLTELSRDDPSPDAGASPPPEAWRIVFASDEAARLDDQCGALIALLAREGFEVVCVAGDDGALDRLEARGARAIGAPRAPAAAWPIVCGTVLEERPLALLALGLGVAPACAAARRLARTPRALLWLGEEDRRRATPLARLALGTFDACWASDPELDRWAVGATGRARGAVTYLPEGGGVDPRRFAPRPRPAGRALSLGVFARTRARARALGALVRPSAPVVPFASEPRPEPGDLARVDLALFDPKSLGASAAMRAQSMGIAVIAPAGHPAAAIVARDQTGIVCAPRSLALARAAAALLADPALLERYGSAARRTIARRYDRARAADRAAEALSRSLAPLFDA